MKFDRSHFVDLVNVTKVGNPLLDVCCAVFVGFANMLWYFSLGTRKSDYDLNTNHLSWWVI